MPQTVPHTLCLSSSRVRKTVVHVDMKCARDDTTKGIFKRETLPTEPEKDDTRMTRTFEFEVDVTYEGPVDEEWKIFPKTIQVVV